jgi:hypothetical protein
MSKTSVTFKTIGGADLTWTLDSSEPQKGFGSWSCGGCGASRLWSKPDGANSHASACRAKS